MEDVILHSSMRAEKRLAFNQHLRQKEEQLARIEKDQLKLREERELEDLRTLRKNLVPQAHPIRHYASVEVKPSSRPLTIPRSPALQTSIRGRTIVHENCEG